MKKQIHPKMNDVAATCVCGAKYPTMSTAKTLEVGICFKCHPFYTGQQKFVDSTGMIEKFQAKYKNLNFDEPSKNSKSKKAK